MKKKQNPTNSKGEILRCNFCVSKFHFVNNCPDLPETFDSDIWLYGHEHNAFLDESTDDLISETFSMALLDSGCTKTVCGETWLQQFLESLSKEQHQWLIVKICLNLINFTMKE